MVSKRATRFSLRIPTVAMGAYAFVGLLSVVALARVYRPIGQWMRYPLVYSSDGLWNLFVIKTVVETGWYHSNAALGVPFGAEFLDFAKPETLFLLFFKVIGWFTGNIPLIHNAFFFLGFPVVAWSATAVFRVGFALPWAFAVTGGLLYAFLPFHFDRMGHLFLSNYFMVPMAVWLMWRVSTSRPPFFERGGLGVGSPTVWSAVALIASTSTYYAVFSLLLILATGGHGGLWRVPRWSRPSSRWRWY
jgi:phosphoglycerol transferase